MDENEAMEWYLNGVPYPEFVRRYKERYGVSTTESMWSKWRRNKKLPRRSVRDVDLIPWAVKPEHRFMEPVRMLRHEARRRAGADMDPAELARLNEWLRWITEQNAVVHYEPNTSDGFYYVPREPGDDELVRPPGEDGPRALRGSQG